MASDPEEDEYMQAYLRSVDLQRLDLNTIELDLAEGRGASYDDEEENGGTPWWRLGLFGTTAAALLILPTTTYYQLHDDTLVFSALSIVAIVLGISLGNWLWRMAVAAQERQEKLNIRFPDAPSMPTLSPTVVRWLLLSSAVILGAILWFALPRDPVWVGNGYGAEWFWSVLVAITIGILLGRWVIAQASAAPKKPRDTTPIKLPPWLKWANLGILLGGASFALFGDRLFSQTNDSTNFGMSGVGLAVGVFGAIWIARRFDEMESKLVQRTRERQRGL